MDATRRGPGSDRTGLDRRDFLKGAAIAPLVGLASSCSTPTRRVFGANSRIRIAVVGVRVQGRAHLMSLVRQPGVDVVALCDPDSAMLAQGARIAAVYGVQPALYTDVRKLLDDRAVDAVTVATPDHWHALIGVWAVSAGKHVYIESPVSHGIVETRLLEEAARKHDRVVQTVLPARSHPAVQDAIQFVHEGGLGQIEWVRAICYRYRLGLGRVEGQGLVPGELDYDLWTGPAPMGPLSRARLHGDWRWDWNTGNGDLGELGVHLLDLANWVLPPRARPNRVWSCGGRMGLDDDGQTPNTLLVSFQGEGPPIIYEQRGMPEGMGSRSRMDRYRGLQNGLVIEGETGYVVIEPGRPIAAVLDLEGRVVERFQGGGDPIANFLAELRGGGSVDAGISVGGAAADLCHIANIAHRTAEASDRVQILRTILGDRELLDSFDRMDTHMLQNGINVQHDKMALSAWQIVDPVTGEFFHNEGANALRARSYRPPFALLAGA